MTDTADGALPASSLPSRGASHRQSWDTDSATTSPTGTDANAQTSPPGLTKLDHPSHDDVLRMNSAGSMGGRKPDPSRRRSSGFKEFPLARPKEASQSETEGGHVERASPRAPAAPKGTSPSKKPQKPSVLRTVTIHGFVSPVKVKKDIIQVSFANFRDFGEVLELNSPRSLMICKQEGVLPHELTKVVTNEFELSKHETKSSPKVLSKERIAMRGEFWEQERLQKLQRCADKYQEVLDITKADAPVSPSKSSTKSPARSPLKELIDAKLTEVSKTGARTEDGGIGKPAPAPAPVREQRSQMSTYRSLAGGNPYSYSMMSLGRDNASTRQINALKQKQIREIEMAVEQQKKLEAYEKDIAESRRKAEENHRAMMEQRDQARRTAFEKRKEKERKKEERENALKRLELKYMQMDREFEEKIQAAEAAQEKRRQKELELERFLRQREIDDRRLGMKEKQDAVAEAINLKLDLLEKKRMSHNKFMEDIRQARAKQKEWEESQVRRRQEEIEKQRETYEKKMFKKFAKFDHKVRSLRQNYENMKKELHSRSTEADAHRTEVVHRRDKQEKDYTKRMEKLTRTQAKKEAKFTEEKQKMMEEQQEKAAQMNLKKLLRAQKAKRNEDYHRQRTMMKIQVTDGRVEQMLQDKEKWIRGRREQAQAQWRERQRLKDMFEDALKTGNYDKLLREARDIERSETELEGISEGQMTKASSKGSVQYDLEGDDTTVKIDRLPSLGGSSRSVSGVPSTRVSEAQGIRSKLPRNTSSMSPNPSMRNISERDVSKTAPVKRRKGEKEGNQGAKRSVSRRDERQQLDYDWTGHRDSDEVDRGLASMLMEGLPKIAHQEDEKENAKPRRRKKRWGATKEEDAFDELVRMNQLGNMQR